MTHLFIILALLQPAPMGPPTACADDTPIGAHIGQPAPCTGVLISTGDSRILRESIAQASRLQLRVDFGKERLARVILERERDADRLDRVLDRGLQLHAETVAPPAPSWAERPGWLTVIVAGGVAFAAGGGVAWAVLR